MSVLDGLLSRAAPSVPSTRTRGISFGVIVALCLTAPALPARADTPRPPTLEARAVLPAETFEPGPVSGTLLGTSPINGVTPPFPGQPVQGFSAVIEGGHGTFWALSDNGYGAKANSADFLLRLHHIAPAWETAAGGPGTITVLGYIGLSDPSHHVPFPIVNEGTADRLLTGADFDLESVRRDRHGDLWFGDEFGPFLLHTDAEGRLVEAPIPLPGVKSPSNPTLGPGEVPNLPNSRGFEGMAIAPNGTTLYPMLEGPLTTDPDQRHLTIFEFDTRSRTWTGTTWNYHLAVAGYSIGDLTALDRHRFLVIERDNLQGTAAAFKKVYVVDTRNLGPDEFLVKHEIVDLLSIADPDLISLPARPGDIGLGATFSFPFQTIESILPLGHSRVLLLNDNNFPFSAGRNPTLPDDDEAIIVRVPGLDAKANP